MAGRKMPPWRAGADVDTWVKEEFGSWAAFRDWLSEQSNEALQGYANAPGTKENGLPRRVRKAAASVLEARQGVAGMAEQVHPRAEEAKERRATHTPQVVEGKVGGTQAYGGVKTGHYYRWMMPSSDPKKASEAVRGWVVDIQPGGVVITTPSGERRTLKPGSWIGNPHEVKNPTEGVLEQGRQLKGKGGPGEAPAPKPSKAQKARREPTTPTTTERPLKASSNADLYDMLENGSAEEQWDAQAELKVRGKPITRPTGHMRDVIAGRTPREEPAAPPPMTEFERRYGTQEERVARARGPKPEELDTSMADTPGRLESTEQTVGARESDEYMRSRREAAPPPGQAEPTSLMEDIGSKTLQGMVARIRLQPKAYDTKGLQGYLPPNADQELSTVYIIRDMVKNKRPGVVVEFKDQPEGPEIAGQEAHEAGRPQLFIPRNLIHTLIQDEKGGWDTTTPRPGDEIQWIEQERALREASVNAPILNVDQSTGDTTLDLRPMQDLREFTNDVIYAHFGYGGAGGKGRWEHLIPIAHDDATNTWRFKMAGREAEGEELVLPDTAAFEFKPPVQATQKPFAKGPSGFVDQYVPQESEVDQRRRESMLRARRELEPQTREEEMGFEPTPPPETDTERMRRLRGRWADLQQRQVELMREMKRAGAREEDIAAMGKGARREIRDTGIRRQQRGREERKQARLQTTAAEIWRRLVAKGYDPDLAWDTALDSVSWQGEAPPRPDEEGTDFGPAGRRGGPAEFSAINEPFFDPFSRMTSYRAEQREPRDVALPQRAEEVSTEQTGNEFWAPEAAQALIEELTQAMNLAPGEATPGEPVAIRRPGAETSPNAPFLQNIQAVPQDIVNALSQFIGLQAQPSLGGTPLPGQGAGEEARLRQLTEHAPAPQPLPPTAVPGATGQLQGGETMTTPMAPEWLRGTGVSNAQPMATPGPMPEAGWEPQRGAGINPLEGQRIMDVLQTVAKTIPAQQLIELFGGAGVAGPQPGPMMPGGVPGGVPVPVGMMTAQAPQQLAAAIMSFMGEPGWSETLNNPGNRPNYGLTEAGPIPFGTQGGWEQGKQGLIELLRQLGIPGF